MSVKPDDSGVNIYWREIIDTMSEGLLVVGRDGAITVANRALERMTGFSGSEMIGKPCTIFNCDACELIRSPTRDIWCKLFEPLNEGVESRRCKMIRKDGSYMTALKNASPLKDENGRVTGVVETLTDLSELERRERKIVELSRRLNGDAGFSGMVGRSLPMRRAFSIIEKAAQSDGPVIIYGESGTGKELAARAIHDLGRNPDSPFVGVNCAALNESIMESELFGHVKGAFTGAHRHRQGRFEAAHGGDLFLDEIGDMPLAMQVKLLRVIENKEVERVGDHRPVPVDIRIIAATHRDLNRMVSQKQFREDLFFRINIIPVHLPALRERKEDIPLLVDHFVMAVNRNHPRAIPGVSGRVMDIFLNYDWPGNIRELKGALEYACVINEGGPIQPEQLPPQLYNSGIKACFEPTAAGMKADAGVQLKSADRRRLLINALKEADGNQSQAARALGVSRITVWNWVKKFNINLKEL